mmetsp:Transcript_13573/g.24428  ORF Transcript_13573/g.24428 Transcript_13573/m.24428 type:complete len:224 (-) Transcript_13573:581-1252(-)
MAGVSLADRWPILLIVPVPVDVLGLLVEARRDVVQRVCAAGIVILELGLVQDHEVGICVDHVGQECWHQVRQHLPDDGPGIRLGSAGLPNREGLQAHTILGVLGSLQHELEDDLVVLLSHAAPVVIHAASKTFANSLKNLWSRVICQGPERINVFRPKLFEGRILAIIEGTGQSKVVQALQSTLPRKRRNAGTSAAHHLRQHLLTGPGDKQLCICSGHLGGSS